MRGAGPRVAMIRIVTTHEPIAQRIVDCAHPDIPDEKVLLTVHQRIATFAFGRYVSGELSGTAVGAYSGRTLDAASWTPELEQAYARLEAVTTLRPTGFTMSPVGYGLTIVTLLAAGALVLGLAQPWLDARASATPEDAEARVVEAFAAPAPGTLLLLGAADGLGFRWFRIDAVDADTVACSGTAAIYDLDYGLPDADALSFDGPRLTIPRRDFTQRGGVLLLDGSTRLVSNAAPR
ncbi:MAG: hypothetical protein ACE37F_30800 [Nannocystaceae bacterium]|nr:hypothetical protein [bacterium]